VREGRKAFFFEKKKQKTFGYWYSRLGSNGPRKQASKFFWFFFEKENPYSLVVTYRAH
jgi:hypothetical protein